jgi:uncharacterized protein (UPF0548 family)
MFFLRKPTESQVRDYIRQQSAQSLSYKYVECTRDILKPRSGWNIDRQRVLLGHGKGVFHRARHAIQHWQMFSSEVAAIFSPGPPQPGLDVAVLYWAAPVRLWLLMAARVVYCLDEPERFGFANGTLLDHAERGEERFLVEWDRSDDRVWYDLAAVSQPRHWLARLGYPYTRYEQARFRRLSAAAMQRAVS